MPMVYIHKILSAIIVSGTMDAVREKCHLCSPVPGIGLCLYVLAGILSHIFAFEVEENIIKRALRS